MKTKKQTGKVIIAGAGPGDPSLITVKAANSLALADVVLVDRLVSEQIISLYCNPSSEIIHVGKQCSIGISTPQQTINELLVDYALAGKNVVRLKGGDVSVFSNILDELEILSAHNIPFEIIPGVTASLGAAAYCGIPLTARGYATSFRVLTFYKSEILSEKQWQELANTKDTLVFYMSSQTLPTLVKNLTERNINKEHLLAVIEQATTPDQQIHITNLYDYEKTFINKKFRSPSIIIIGKVVSLHNEYNWFKNEPENKNYFPAVKEGKVTIKMTA